MPRANVVAALSLLVAFLALGDLGYVLLQQRLHRPTSVAADGGTTAATAQIDMALAKLTVERRGGELTWEKAMRVRMALRAHDFATASKITAEILAASRIRSWDFGPFDEFIAGIQDVTDASLEARLSEWVNLDARDPLPFLVRAQYYYNVGWFRRGGQYANATQALEMMAFQTYMSKALSDVESALHLSETNPYAFKLKLLILSGDGASKRMVDGFKEAIAKYPDYYPLYTAMLRTLQPQWGGSAEYMRAFVNEYAGSVPETSPRKMLYVSLYRQLIAVAVNVCKDEVKPEECIAAQMQQIVTPDVQSQLQTALQLYDRTDKYQFGLVMKDILYDSFYWGISEFYTGALLELAASSMHSDTRLHLNPPGGNDYMLDLLVAESWYRKGFNDNALEKDGHALKDIEAATDLSDEQRDSATALVYAHFARVYAEMGRTVDMIAAAKAAAALGGNQNEQHLICFGYFQLKDYKAASPACVRALDTEPTNMRVHYLRGQIFQAAGKDEDALREYTIVADSTDYIRSTGPIAMSMIYFDRKDLAGALGVLNKYTYLYNTDMTGRSDMSVAYNNRCYAYMELGELEKALEDCTASLKYGSIPDAYRKQLELMKLLGKKAPDL